ncbi:MAG: DUF348 domain-containing protein [Propionibacterium sp.]|jgi:uncharacterized protein YabE (DUF348 family)|nr:ubiquitin-like domain-containing protein [Propionibacterium sp.]NLI84146.1 DUF348 domain-containing protein [Propionibacterium sp.]
MKRSVTIAVAGVVTVASLSIGGIASAANKAVELTIDGQQQVVHVWGTTVQDVLDANGIQINDADELSPAANTPLSDGTEVTVKYVRPVTVITDGVSQTYWTTATTVQDALAEIGLHDPATRLSVDRSTPLGREGLTLTASTPKTVHLTVDGQTIDTVTTAADVKSLLNEAGIRLGSNDRVTPERNATLTEGATVQVQRVDVSEVNETEKIDYQSVRAEDSTLAKGVTKVTTEGKPGEKKVLYQVTSVDGTEESRTVLSEEVITQPVDEQVSVGTKATSYTGSHADWMSAAGIAESDWSAAEILVQRESSWNPSAVNASSGACGLVQSLPCSKLGPNWTDPVVALKWGDQYVKERYGGWQQALAHSYSYGWY